MGQKVNPIIFRKGIIKTWPSKWFKGGKSYINNTQQDIKIREFLFHQLREAGVDRVEVERSANKVAVNLFVAKPGLVIGRAGVEEENYSQSFF